MKRAGNVVLLAVLLLSIGSCGSSTSAWLATFATGFGVSSLTASSSGTASLTRSGETLTGSEPFNEKAATLEAIAKGTATNGCAVTLPTLNGFSGRANCYGPSVAYADHPDGGGGSGTFPGGDLGIWEASQDSSACAAAQINTLMKNVSKYIDTAMMLQASSICVLGQSVGTGTTALPSSTADVTFTDDFQTKLKEKNASATITLAKVSVPATDIYQYVLQGTTDGTKAFEITFRIKKTSDTSYQGRIYGYFTTASNRDAFSVTFKRSGTSVNTRLLAGSWTTSATSSQMIDTNGDLKQDDSFSGNMNQAIMSFDTDTKLGNVSYAWQAGSGDNATRTFNAYTTASGSSVEGCGFFGFGTEFQATHASNTNTINGFICNWAGPGNSHAMTTTTGKAQKQCFSKNATSGLFEEVTAKRAITYSPENDCNDASAFTYAYPAHSGDGATNNLVTLISDADVAVYSSPSAPTLDSGI